jgi:hypothetical protein
LSRYEELSKIPLSIKNLSSSESKERNLFPRAKHALARGESDQQRSEQYEYAQSGSPQLLQL